MHDNLPSAVFLHGFGQNHWCGGQFLDSLREHCHVITPDLPGHGDNSVALDPWETAAQLSGLVREPSLWVGYSFGARMLLHLAIAFPEIVTKMVLIGGSPGIADATERTQRRFDDDQLATHIESVGVAHFTHEWLQNPVFDGLSSENQFTDERNRNSSRGLASSLRLAGTGAQESLWDRLEEITVPTLLLTGVRDIKFSTIAAQMVTQLPHGRCGVIPDAGHSAHLENPSATLNAVLDFVQQAPTTFVN